jgi:NTE family protein
MAADTSVQSGGTDGAKADEKRVDLVFEGGGVKGIGLAGAFCHLLDQGYQPQRVAGTSAGAITAALVAAGYDADKLRKLVLEDMKYGQFEDGHRLPGGEFIELLHRRGLHPGKYFEGWMREHLEETGITKFGQLREAAAAGDGGGAAEAAAYKLQVIASDVTCERMLTLPLDAKHLGVDPDELEIATAVRMSMSIPIFFDPVVFKNPQNGEEHVIVDGGLLSNFPVWLFDCKPGEVPRWPTFGLLLVAPNQQAPLIPGGDEAAERRGGTSLLSFLLSIGRTMMEAHDRLYVEQANYARTIPIDTLGVGTTQFSIDDDADLKQRLFQSGSDAAAEFLKTWDFAAYVKAFRGTAQSSRRARVAEVLDRHAGPAGQSAPAER